MIVGLYLDDIINVNVEVSQMSVAAKNFNLGLIIGNSQIAKLSGKIKLYSSLNEMSEDGFTNDKSEYKAAALYFGQSPAPDYVAIGLIPTSGEAIDALKTFRASNIDWYAFTFTKEVAATLTDEKITAIAAYVEAEKTPTVWFNLLTKAEGYLTTMTTLKTAKYSRTLSMYSSKDATATAGIMGYAMGANYEGAPAYTLAYKTIVGMAPEDNLDSAGLKSILDANGNVYVTQGSYYNLFRQGSMANGFSFDDVLYLDMLLSRISQSVMDQLTTLPKVPQTSEGVDVLTAALTEPCQYMADKGYLAPGKWTGRKVLSLQPGDMLSKGYMILSESIYNQSKADRDARKSPPIYVCIKTGGAIEHLTLGVIVNR